MSFSILLCLIASALETQNLDEQTIPGNNAAIHAGQKRWLGAC